MARYGEEPELKLGFSIVLVAAFEHAQLGFLKQVLRRFVTSSEVDQITKEAIMVLVN
jgi:hypothetical protein